MRYLAGIDVATTGAKVLLVDENGDVAASASRGYELKTPRPGWAEQSPEDWWYAVKSAIGEVLAVSGISPAEIEGIGLTGQMHGSVFLDKEGCVLYPAILWCDGRTAAECDLINSLVGAERILDITCNPVLTGFQAPKILWLRGNRPELYEKTSRILLPKDYIRFCLTGDYSTDVSDASGTSLFDVRKRDWSEEILGKLGIDKSLMPQAFESIEKTGTVSGNAAEATGLKAGTPVVAGGGDQAAGGIGSGVVEEGLVSITLGTSGVIFAHAEEVILDPEGRLHTFCHAVPGKWHIMGVMLSAGGALRWFRDNIMGGGLTYDDIDKKALSVGPGSEGAVFLPYLFGERCPYPDPGARAVFFGLSAKHTDAHLARAVMEGVGFGLKDILEVMGDMGLEAGGSLRLSGGGAGSACWPQILADILAKDISVLEQEGGAAYGSAIIAGAGTGIYEDIPSACRRLAKEKKVFQSGRKNATIYGQVYNIYRDLYPALKDSFKRISGLTGE